MSSLVVPLPGWREPIDVLPLFAADPMPALLCSGQSPGPDAGINRWSILCASPFDTLRWSVGEPADPFRLLERALGEPGSVVCTTEQPMPDIPFHGGLVGYIGYGVGRAVESIRTAPRRHEGPEGDDAATRGIPDLLFGVYAWGIVWDHHRRWWGIVSSGRPETGPLARGSARAARALHDAEAIRLRLAGPGPDRGAGPPPPSSSTMSSPTPPPLSSTPGTSLPRDQYLAMVERAQRLIADGEIYQVNLSQRLELPPAADPVSMFRGIARHSPAPFSAYIDAGHFQIASASPERFLSLRGRCAESRPIKGTRPRGGTAELDARLARDLARSPKDRAENVMIVDLVRNDLGRVCSPGSVRATVVCSVESYASVHHLISVVNGDLAPHRDRGELLRAMFPGGSMTGAPKRAAMQVIEDLEPVPRGIYAGAAGYLSFCGAMDFSIVIRTAIVANGRTWLNVGGGIVADSDPAAEWQESLDKAASVLRGMGLSGMGLPG